jgi:HPt (histidine-containing phosphotransfer) domain-containing protein
MTTSGPNELADALFQQVGDALFLFDSQTDQIRQASGVARSELLSLRLATLAQISSVGEQGKAYARRPLQALGEVLVPAAGPCQTEGRAMAVQRTINYDAALSYVGGDADLLRELAGVFLAEAPKMLNAVRDAVHASDAVRLKRAAHTLKGSAGTFGAQAVHDAARKLEVMGMSNDLTGAEASWAELEGAGRDLCQALAELAEGSVK